MVTSNHKLNLHQRNTINLVHYVLAQIFRQVSGDPLQKLLATRFAKDCMETFNDDFIQQSQTTILPLIEKICLFAKENTAQDRGKHYFSSDPSPNDSKIGNSFLQLNLECIWVWAKWFPIDPENSLASLYKIAVERLLIQGVTFPTLEFFDVVYVKKYLPELMVPIKITQEVKKFILEDLKKSSESGSYLRLIQDKLQIDLRRELTRDDRQIVFYSDRIRRAMKKSQRKTQREIAKQRASKYMNENELIQAERRSRSIQENSQNNELQTNVQGNQFLPVIKQGTSPELYNSPQGQSQSATYQNFKIKQLQSEMVHIINEKLVVQQLLREREAEIDKLKFKLQAQEQRLTRLDLYEQKSQLVSTPPNNALQLSPSISISQAQGQQSRFALNQNVGSSKVIPTNVQSYQVSKTK